SPECPCILPTVTGCVAATGTGLPGAPNDMPKMPVKVLLLLMLAAFAAPAGAQYGAMTIPRSLDQLTGRSAVILRGTVTSARVEKPPVYRGLDTVVVSLHVSDRLKG